MFHNSKTTCLVYPLALRTSNITIQPSKCRTLFHNSKITRSVYPSVLPLQPKVGFIPVNLSIRNSTPRNLSIYLQNFNWLLQRQRILERNDEKELRNSSSSAVKWQQSAKHGEWAFPRGQHTPLQTFTPGQCMPPSTIMQFRRNVYEYSAKNSTYHFRMQSEREQTLGI